MTLGLSFFYFKGIFTVSLYNKKNYLFFINLIIINGYFEKSLMSLKADEVVKALLHSSSKQW